MQNHRLEPLSVRSTSNNSNNNTPFTIMLQSSSSNSGSGGNDGFPSSTQQHGHDFTTLTSVNGNDYGHLSHNNNHHHHNHPSNHGGSGGHHHQSSNSTNNNNSGHSSSTTSQSQSNTSGNNTTKPKKPPPPNGKKTKGRVKIKMEFIDNKLRRYTTFSKRKTGIMKKAYELSTLTGTQVMLLVASETGHVYTFATRKLQPMITSEAGKALIQTCLNSPDPPNSGSDTQRMSATGYEETELTYAADPNGSDHDIKDEESESGGSSDEEDPSMNESEMSSPPTISLANGILPANFAALLAASSSGLNSPSLKAGGLSIGLVSSPSSTTSSTSSFSSSMLQSNNNHRQQQNTNQYQRPNIQQHHNESISISPIKNPPKNIQPRNLPQKKQQQQISNYNPSPIKNISSKHSAPTMLPSSKISTGGSSQGVKPSKIKREGP